MLMGILVRYNVTCNIGVIGMKTTVDRVKKHRSALRAAGLRPVQIWVPDTRRKGFAQECRRQSRTLLGDPNEQAILRWLSKVSAQEGWK